MKQPLDGDPGELTDAIHSGQRLDDPLQRLARIAEEQLVAEERQRAARVLVQENTFAVRSKGGRKGKGAGQPLPEKRLVVNDQNFQHGISHGGRRGNFRRPR